MRALAAYIMRGRPQAILVTAVTALLSLLLPPLSYLSGATIALVTMRMGAQQGLVVLILASIATGLLSLLILGSSSPGLVFLAALWLPVWILGLSLRRTASLSRSILLAALFGTALILGVHAGTEDPAQWWMGLFEQMLQGAESEGATEGMPDLSLALAELSQLMTGVMAAALTMTLIGSLFIGRWWQALLYNPGGFREEFHALTLGKVFAGVVVVVLLMNLPIVGGVIPVASDLLILAGFLFVFQGIAVVHGIVGKTGAHKGWLIAMYVLLLLPMTMTQMLIVLSAAGFGDNFIEFRAYFGNKAKD